MNTIFDANSSFQANGICSSISLSRGKRDQEVNKAQDECRRKEKRTTSIAMKKING